MFWSEPENFYDALKPMTSNLCSIGLGSFVYGDHKRLRLLSFLYRIFLILIYFSCFATSVHKMSLIIEPPTDIAVVALIRTFRVYGNAAVVLIVLGFRQLHDNLIHTTLKRIVNLDQTMTALGVKFNYLKLRRNITIALSLVSVLVSACCVFDFIQIVWDERKLSLCVSFMIFYFYHYPLILTVCVNTVLVVLNLIMSERFRKLNDLLKRSVERSKRNSMFLKGKPSRMIDTGPKIVRPAWAIGNQPILSYQEMNHLVHRSDLVNPSHFASVELIRSIRSLHHELCEIGRTLNCVYGVQLLAVTTLGFGIITGDLYSLYTVFASHTSLDFGIMFTLIVWPFLCSGLQFVLAATTDHCLDQANRTGYVIHKITTTDPAMRAEVFGFSLQLMNQPLHFTACGFFPVDYTMIGKMIATITTFLVILIQLSDSSDSSQVETFDNETSSSHHNGLNYVFRR